MAHSRHDSVPAFVDSSNVAATGPLRKLCALLLALK